MTADRRAVAPTAPYTDPAAVVWLAGQFGEFERPSRFELAVTVQCRQIDLFCLRLSESGCAGLDVRVRTPRPVAATTVAHLARARVAGLEITEPVEESCVTGWFETAKAAASFRLPLQWHGTLPAEVRRHAWHLTPNPGRPALLGWRRGPGFAEVVDQRSGHRRSLVDLATVTSLFGEGLDIPAPLSGDTAELFGEGLDTPAPLSGDTAELIDAGLAMAFRGEAVWLPYRLRASSSGAA
ncbi:MAG TPA: hypothetical protein VF062_01065 [Candidatus Limnocylindrales bacterium]